MIQPVRERLGHDQKDTEEFETRHCVGTFQEPGEEIGVSRGEYRN